MSLFSKAKSVISKVGSAIKKITTIPTKIGPQPASVGLSKSTQPFKSALPTPKPLGGLSSGKTPTSGSSTKFIGPLQPKPKFPNGPITQIGSNWYPAGGAITQVGDTFVPAKNISIKPSGGGGSSSNKLTATNTPSNFDALSFGSETSAFSVPANTPASSGASYGGDGGIGAYLGASAGSTANPALNPNMGAYNPMASYEEEQKKRQKEAEKSQRDLIKMMNELAGKPAEAVRLEGEAGIPQTEAEIRDLQAKQSAETAQYIAQTQAIQNKPIAMEFIAGQQGEVQRRYGIDALITSSLVQAKSGQLETAKASVDRALSLKYDPIEARIKTQEQILQFNYDNLDRADKKLADARLEVLNSQKEDLQQFKDIQTETVKTALANGASSDVVSAIMNATSVADIGKIGGQYAPAGTFMDFGTSTSGFTPTQQSNFNKIPDNLKTSVLELVNGDVLLSDLVKSRGIQGTQQIQQLLSYAQAIDPTYSPNTEKIRYEFKKQWSTDAVKGAVGSQTAINTALGHLADLAEASRSLPANVLKKMNSVKNILSKEFGDPSVTNFRIVLNALGTELARVYKGGVPNEGEIKEWQESLASNFSQSQLNGAFNTTSKLLSSKLTALRYKYTTTMGREYDQSLIDPDKREALIQAGINPDYIIKENLPTSVAGSTLVDGFSETW
jgi:hypothetical protein